jgi:hypothetical protein
MCHRLCLARLHSTVAQRIRAISTVCDDMPGVNMQHTLCHYKTRTYMEPFVGHQPCANTLCAGTLIVFGRHDAKVQAYTFKSEASRARTVAREHG